MEEDLKRIKLIALMHKVIFGFNVLFFALFWTMGFVSSEGTSVFALYRLCFFTMTILAVFTVLAIVFFIFFWIREKRNTMWYICFALLRVLLAILLVLAASLMKSVSTGELTAICF